ncbi:hypothetical protein GCM10011341_13080 [Frigidibacter albus]|nr:hypothetical protein GCM10011341_13080 [Frigidibacter albus]
MAGPNGSMRKDTRGRNALTDGDPPMTGWDRKQVTSGELGQAVEEMGGGVKRGWD